MDWTNIISSLVEVGIDRETIAKKVGCSLSLINALAQGRRGKRLSFEIGNKLLELWRRTCTAGADTSMASNLQGNHDENSTFPVAD
ncbi:hypothetical protein BUE93_08580 [Chromobacterium amazonense]|uniref:HTH cro/C1-type domain-containing protein n=2 Tax=Chromobacterium amazonense TaxID=1382803 RepID=A0A2S9X5J6_9NEIS|nr:hypothetical protein BUE93_08580 [Chromobacterium amazonense]